MTKPMAKNKSRLAVSRGNTSPRLLFFVKSPVPVAFLCRFRGVILPRLVGVVGGRPLVPAEFLMTLRKGTISNNEPLFPFLD